LFVDRPHFVPGQESYIYTWAGQHSLIECSFLAEPVASVDWLVKGTKLQSNDTFHITHSVSKSTLQVGKLYQFVNPHHLL